MIILELLYKVIRFIWIFYTLSLAIEYSTIVITETIARILKVSNTEILRNDAFLMAIGWAGVITYFIYIN